METRKSDHLWYWLKVFIFWNRSDLWNQPIKNGEILVSLFIDMPCYVLISRSINKLMYWIWHHDIIKKNTQLKKVVLNAFKNIYGKNIIHIEGSEPEGCKCTFPSNWVKAIFRSTYTISNVSLIKELFYWQLYEICMYSTWLYVHLACFCGARRCYLHY